MLLGLVNISLLYVWEIVYRLEMHWTLTCHHLVTMVLVVASTALMYDFESEMEMEEPGLSRMVHLQHTVQRIILVEVLFGMTNQPALIALMLHRASSSSAPAWFLIAAIWELV